VRLLIATVVLASAATAASAATVTGHPTLRVASASPLIVTGSSFAPHERVTVTTLTTVRRKRIVVFATAKGRIRVSFGKISQPCAAPFAVRAVGVKSGAALVRLAGRPCVPPPV
jgi:hypothetical protein